VELIAFNTTETPATAAELFAMNARRELFFIGLVFLKFEFKIAKNQKLIQCELEEFISKNEETIELDFKN
jgi:hypothetical protein